MTINEISKSENINKSWAITMFGNQEGFIENYKKGIKANFRLGDENGIYGNELYEKKIPVSIWKSANSIAKKLWNQINQDFRFSYSRTKVGDFRLTNI